MTITVSRMSFERELLSDDDPDASYLEQEGFEDRLAAYRRRDFYFVGVRVAVTIEIPVGHGFILQRITSPGLWGIENDSGEDYFAEVFAEEGAMLEDMLRQLGYAVVD